MLTDDDFVLASFVREIKKRGAVARQEYNKKTSYKKCKLKLKRWISQWEMDFWHELIMIRKSQYGDTNFGHDMRKTERLERLWREKIKRINRGPCHNGLEWGNQ